MANTVIRASKKFLPNMAAGCEHPKVKIHIGDGFVFLEDKVDSFVASASGLTCPSSRRLRVSPESCSPRDEYGFTTIPTYPCGQIGLMVCSKDPIMAIKEPVRHWPKEQEAKLCRYYNSGVPQGMLCAPPVCARCAGGSRGIQWTTTAVSEDVVMTCHDIDEDIPHGEATPSPLSLPTPRTTSATTTLAATQPTWRARAIAHTDILLGSDGRSKGCGVVELKRAEHAQEAIHKFDDVDLMGRATFVREDRETEGRIGFSGGRGSGVSSKRDLESTGRQVYASNLLFSVNWTDIRRAGPVVRADIFQTSDMGSKGIGNHYSREGFRSSKRDQYVTSEPLR
ncbi:hypothetical protein EC968_007559 [Mortierella alpina]|nr:hypothetical protein EC968_007559 [Mortierella alpina]